MNSDSISASNTVVTPARIRLIAIALFAIISASLWTGFAFDTYFASDGAFYFPIILDNATFTHIAPSRLHAEYLSQWPLVLGVRAGLTDLATLEFLFGLGLWFPWLLGFVISLYATRARPELIFFYLISLISLNFAAWSVYIGEHHVLLTLSWPIFYFALRNRPLNLTEQLLTVVLLIIHLRLYEAAIATGSLFTITFLYRAWFNKSPHYSQSERWTSILFAALSISSVVIALYWVINPRDADNRSSFLQAMIDSLAHPYPWIGVSFVILTGFGLYLGSRKMLLAGWIVPLSIAIFSLFLTGIPGGMSFGTRTLALTELPLLMLAAAALSLGKVPITKSLITTTALVITSVSILHVRHLQDWITFRAKFQNVLSQNEGYIEPEPYGEDLKHWGWTNPLLSYLWVEGGGEVKTIILNPATTTYNPFDPQVESILHRYLPPPPILRQP